MEGRVRQWDHELYFNEHLRAGHVVGVASATWRPLRQWQHDSRGDQLRIVDGYGDLDFGHELSG
jgi:hypothetical protein